MDHWTQRLEYSWTMLDVLLRKEEAEAISHCHSGASNWLVKTLQSIEMQKLAYAVGAFSIFEARLQDHYPAAPHHAFKKARTDLATLERHDIHRRFELWNHAINVLKHGKGVSLTHLLAANEVLPFKLKGADESFIEEGDVMDPGSLIRVDSQFVTDTITLIRQVSELLGLRDY